MRTPAGWLRSGASGAFRPVVDPAGVALSSAPPIVIVPVALNYAQRLIMIMPPFTPTGDAAVDLPKIKALYTADMARHPESF